MRHLTITKTMQSIIKQQRLLCHRVAIGKMITKTKRKMCSTIKIIESLIVTIGQNIEEHSKALSEYAKQFNQRQKERFMTDDNDELLELFEESIHCPENVITDAPKFLVYHQLYHQSQLEQFEKGEIEERPPCQFMLVEGLPGVRKTFVIKTLRKIVRIIKNTNKGDAPSIPTGCLVALINGSMHVCLMGIPIGKKLVQAPTSMTGTKIDAIKHTRKCLRVLIC